jgi:hypothetical protein
MRNCLYLAVVVPLAACSSVTVDSDHEAGVDFSAHRTFAFLHPVGKSGVGNEIVERRIRASLERGLGAEGLTRKASGADLLVAYRVGVRDRIEIRDWGYPYRYHHRWYGYRRTTVRAYREGRFVLDLVDARTKRLVWRGWATDVMADPSPSAEAIDRIVTALLAEYPPTR